MSDSIIEVHDLHKTYREGLFVRKQVNALRGVTLEVPRGCIFGLLGPNGAGKTTLIKVLLGLVRRSSGGGNLLGRPLGDRVGRMKVGYLPEHHRFPRHLTGNAAMVYYGGLSGLSRREVLQKRPALLDRVGLSKWGQTPVHKYSKGMQQRLGIAQALLHNPELLILDEPTDGVDPVGRAEVRRLLKELQQEGTTIFLNSHQLQEIELVCDQAAILAAGRVQKLGTIEEITKQPSARMEFVLQGSIDDMQYALTFAETEPWQTDGDHLARVIVSAEDQAALNRCVDALRQKQIDILEMRRLRTTLEDAFLNIVSADTVEQLSLVRISNIELTSLMRPYLTVIYDSFHEAFVSRVLYILLLALTLVLLAIAPLGYEIKRMVTLHRMSILDVPSFVNELRQQNSAEGESPGKRIVSLAGGKLKELVDAPESAKFSGQQVNDVVEGLNEVLGKKEFYSEAAWKDVKLGEETKVLLKQGPEKLKGDDLTYFNRLLMRDAYPVYLGNVPAEQLYLTYPLLWQPLPLPITQDMFEMTVKYMLTGFIDIFVGMFAIFVAILVTAPIMPRTFEPGAIDLLLSKPISRSLLILAKYLGGCAFVLLSVTYFLVGLWLIVGWRFEIWSNSLLLCIPVFVFQFAIYYCVSVLAGVMWRNAIVSIVVTVLFFLACFGIGTLKTSVFEPFIVNPTRLVRLVETEEGLVGVTQVGQFVQWNETLRGWEVVLQSERRGPENFAMQSILIGPIYNEPTQSMMYLQQPTGGGGRRRGGSSTSFMTAKWSGNWVAENGPNPPTGASWILQDANDNVLVVSSAGVFLYEGDGTQKKAKFLGFDIPLGGNNAFKRIGPDKGVPYFPPFAAAIDPASDRLLVENQGTLYLLERDAKKGYIVATEAKRESEGETAVGLTGKVAVVADAHGHIELRDAKTLEVQKSLRPAGDTPPSSLETSRDGKFIAVLFHDGSLWLYDVEAGEGSRIDSDASAIAFDEDNLLFADNKTRVQVRSLANGETIQTYWPESDWWRFTYDWIIEPIYYVFPKPGELNNLLKYLVTDESTSSFQGPQSSGDLREVRMADNIVMPVVHNLIFICVMLGITCFYVSRLDLQERGLATEDTQITESDKGNRRLRGWTRIKRKRPMVACNHGSFNCRSSSSSVPD